MLARSEKPFPLCEPAVILNNSRTSIRSTELVGQNVAKIPLWRPTPVASRLVKPRKGVAGTKVPALIERQHNALVLMEWTRVAGTKVPALIERTPLKPWSPPASPVLPELKFRPSLSAGRV